MLFETKLSKYFLLSNLNFFVSLASILKYCTIENEFIKALINVLTSHNDTTMPIFFKCFFFLFSYFSFYCLPLWLSQTLFQVFSKYIPCCGRFHRSNRFFVLSKIEGIGKPIHFCEPQKWNIRQICARVHKLVMR